MAHTGIDKSTGRLIGLITLLIVVAAALRGHLPAAGRASRHQQADSPAALAVVVIVLGVSLAIVALSIITRLRHRRAMVASLGALSARRIGRGERPSWRVLLICLALLSAWLLLMWLLTKVVGHFDFGPAGKTSTAGSDVPTTAGSSPPAGATPQQKPPRPDPGGDMFGYLAAAAAAMLLMVIAGAVAAARRQRSQSAPPAVPLDEPDASHDVAAGSASLARAAERGLAEIAELGRAPREAIIACYATMERELTRLPDAAPQAFDTPTEVLARAVEQHALPADNATRLVKLFAEARFSAHLMTERHRDDAVRALRVVLAELPSRR